MPADASNAADIPTKLAIHFTARFLDKEGENVETLRPAAPRLATASPEQLGSRVDARRIDATIGLKFFIKIGADEIIVNIQNGAITTGKTGGFRIETRHCRPVSD
jgi:hypothetical protein